MRDRAFLAACAACVAAGRAQGDWTYQVITPLGQSGARAYALGPGQVAVGSVGSAHAALWTLFSPAGVADLNPSGATESSLVFTTGTQHVGNAVIGGVRRAGVWSGDTPGSFTSLHPAGYTITYAQGTDGTHQSGFGTTTAGRDHALLWSGSAGSAIELDPVSSVNARAYQTGGGRQVGWAKFSPNFTTPVAGYWEGTAASWTVLGVPGGFSSPLALCISPDGQEQAGQAVGATGVNWAVLWHGSTASFVSLHPTGYAGSNVLSTGGEYQTGNTIQFGTGSRAALRHGSAASFVDLSSFLPGPYTISEAWGSTRIGNDLWVAGRAYNTATGLDDAILWHNTVPSPGAALAMLGMLVPRRRRRGNIHAGSGSRATYRAPNPFDG